MSAESDVDLMVRARRVVTPDGEVAASVAVSDERIVEVGPVDASGAGARVVELGDDVVLLPGLVDSHVHVNDPGRSEWEGFPTATAAAAAGGVTTIVDMPLNCLPPTVDVAALDVKRAAASGNVYVDVGFWGGAVPGNDDRLGPLYEAGVFGFKCFLLHSGVDEFPPLDAVGLRQATRILAARGAMLILHAEDSDTVASAPPAGGRDYQRFLDSRPPDAERRAVRQVVELVRETGVRAHILHLSDAGCVPMLAAARAEGLSITAETCPHYLSFCAEEIPDGQTQFKCCPPIRGATNRERLWDALADGVVDCVVSDHSPCTEDLKRFDTGDFGAAWGGIASLQLGLSAVWTGARQRGHRLTDVMRWMASGPADLLGMRRKGRIAAGCDADFCAFAPEDAFVVDRFALWHRNPVTAYDGRPLAGVVRRTWLRGEEITGCGPAKGAARGRLLQRGET